jgi:hypothetical protein
MTEEGVQGAETPVAERRPAIVAIGSSPTATTAR